MTKRLAMAAFIAAILGAAAYAAFVAPWYVVTVGDYGQSLELLDFELPDAQIVVMLVALLVQAYFFGRLLFTGLLLLNGGPTSTRVIAWYTPLGAHVQGGFALAGAAILLAFEPRPPLFLDFAREAMSRDYTSFARSWGGTLLLISAIASHVAIYLIARDPELARTQTWADEEGNPVEKPKRWIRMKAKERPLVKPPLSPAPSVEVDPFRAAPPTGIAAAIVKPETKREAPRADKADAPAPKLLV